MKTLKIILMITAGTIASTANARDHKLDIDVQIKNPTPQLAASLDQSHFLIKNRQFGLAVDVLRKIIRSQPKNASAYSAIAVAYDGLGRPDLARKNFEMALAYAPLEGRHYRNLARHLSLSGEMSLARNIMKDFEIARVQNGMVEVKPIIEPALDITTLLSRLELESMPIGSDLPSKVPDVPLPENPAKGLAAIIVGDVRSTFQILAPVAAGNDTDDPKNRASAITTIGTDTNYYISLATIDDVEDAIAEIYAGLGIVKADSGSDGEFLTKTENQIGEVVLSNSRKLDIKAAPVRFAKELDVWLKDLAKRQPDNANNRQWVKSQRTSEVPNLNLKAENFQLIRQSLGEVLLTSTNGNLFASKPVRTAFVFADNTSKLVKKGSVPSNASHYLAAVRSIFDSRKNGIAIASPDVLTDLALKQLDMAMSDLEQKRSSRLPRVDQGPSLQLQQIAVTLHKEADAARKILLQPPKQNVRVALFYRTDTVCAA
jgi:tetratricopeptide (TPR) repeat protein